MQAMLRAVAIAVDSFRSPLSASMRECIGVIDCIRLEAARVVANLAASLPSFDGQDLPSSDGQRERRKSNIRFGTALKTIFLSGKKLQELRAQIRGISTSLSAALIAANSIQINEMNDLARLDSISSRMECVLRQITLAGSDLSLTEASIDDNDSAMVKSPHKDPESQNNSAVSSMASEPCRPFCPCQCHKTTVLRSPPWLDAIFGSVTISTNTTLSFNRPHCSLPQICNRGGRLSAGFSYFAPAWVLARAFSVLISRTTVGGMNADLAIRAPRILPPGARAISCASNGAVELVRDMITNGEASIYDVDHRGASLLFASLILI
jgi:hypothetical protein